jgi:hypothetical protein
MVKLNIDLDHFMVDVVEELLKEYKDVWVVWT